MTNAPTNSKPKDEPNTVSNNNIEKEEDAREPPRVRGNRAAPRPRNVARRRRQGRMPNNVNDAAPQIAPEKVKSMNFYIRGVALREKRNPSYIDDMDCYLLGDADSKTIASVVTYNLAMNRADVAGMRERFEAIDIVRSRIIPSSERNAMAFPRTAAEVKASFDITPKVMKEVRKHIEQHGTYGDTPNP